MSNKTEGGIPAEKKKRIAVGATVGGTLLIVFLLIVLIILFVKIGVKRSDMRRLDRLIAQQQEIVDDEKEDLDDLLNGFGLFWKALDNGYKYKS